ncbi:hypothetical protein L6R52_11235 [Myxococcota bacterium]|nr:hypothetical protein [Myxococcota bacterium]
MITKTVARSALRGLALAVVPLAVACSTDGEGARIETSSSSGWLRPDHVAYPTSEPGYDPNETVESWVSPAGRIRVHFSRTGRNAVLAADADTSGVPDFVELTGRTYDAVRDVYHGPLGLREPVSDAILGGANDGGDDLFDVYLVDFAGRGDGAYRQDACRNERPSECTGFMLQENDFRNYGYPSLEVAIKILASHEYFHAVQAAYDADQDVVFSEGTAVWATERFDVTLADFEAFIGAFLERPDRPLNVVSGGVVDAKSYGTAIFFQFLTERYDPLAVPSLLEDVADGANGVADPEWFADLDPWLQRRYGSSFAEALSDFAVWNLYLRERANAAWSYDRGNSYPAVTMEATTLPLHVTGPRYFSASAKYYSADVDGRAEATAALVVAPGEESELDGLRVFLAAVRGRAVSMATELTDVTAGVETIDLEAADEVVAIVVNTNPSGNSKRPDLCFGAPAEVAACKSDVLPAPDAGVALDSGVEVPDSGVDVPDAGVSAPDAGVAAESDGGCAAVKGSDAGAGLLVGLTLLGLARRRRRSVR